MSAFDAVCSLDDDDDTASRPAKIEYLYFIYDTGNSRSRLDGAYKIPLKYAVRCELFKVATESAIASQSSDVDDYTVELFESNSLINVNTLDWIFSRYLPIFGGEEILPVAPNDCTEFNPLEQCPRSNAFLQDFHSKEGVAGLQRLSATAVYLGISWLFECTAKYTADIFVGKTFEEIGQLLLIK